MQQRVDDSWLARVVSFCAVARILLNNGQKDRRQELYSDHLGF